ncbi:MAG: hypothetical protein M3S32_07210 [Acidobacteriota bacterium]|nr:hypothetical protein [Acidobacteriota bacterium]
MKTKWFALAPALVAGFGAFALSSPARGQDAYCSSPYQQQQVYVDGYASGGYGYARPYEHQGYSRPYGHSGSYGQGYGYARPYQQPYREGYSRRYSSYDGQGYGDQAYGDQAYGDGYGSGYGGQTVHEDHGRTTLRLFPFPHIDKRIVHHEHPIY